MLDKNINELARLSNESILTPYNLLENMQQDNYLSINYYKQNEYIAADIVFLVHNEEIKFRYMFDYNNFLQKIYHVNGDNLIVQFDREKEKEKIASKLQKNHTFKKCM